MSPNPVAKLAIRGKPVLRPPTLGGSRAGVSQRGRGSTRPARRKRPGLPVTTGAGDIRRWLSGGPRAVKAPAEVLREGGGDGDTGGQGK